MSHYSACQIKFAFDISISSPLAWYEYFGWSDNFDMIHYFMKKHLTSDTLSFSGIDDAGAKTTVIFETVCEPEKFQIDYNLALTLLNKLSENPPYNDNSVVFNNMLELLEEENITIFEDEPDLNVFLAYNKLNFGFETYQEHIINSVLERLEKDHIKIIKKIPDEILLSLYNNFSLGQEKYTSLISDYIK